MWQPIAEPAERAEYWNIITAIEHALAEAAPHRDPGIGNGEAGVALFHAHLHAAGASDTAADRALEALDTSTGAIANSRLLPTLYTGFFGIGWVVAHLTREVFEGDADLTSELDDALRQLLSEANAHTPFELIGGLAGYGTYLVERLPNPNAAELLRRVIDLLDASRDDAGAWFTDPDWLPQWQRERMPRGCHNLGVAHGIPGVFGMLAAAKREGFDDSRLADLTAGAVDWLLRQQRPDLESSVFPSHLPPDGEPLPTRTAWCYGDLGIAAVLLSAAQAFDREDWRNAALSIARIAAARTFEETRAMDVGLCHGAIGIAHLFNRIAQATQDEGMREAARRWYRQSLDLRRPGEGVAGFVSWNVERYGEPGTWKGERGFLGGVAGVGLALLAAVTDREPVWDRVMLVAVPPQNGAAA